MRSLFSWLFLAGMSLGPAQQLDAQEKVVLRPKDAIEKCVRTYVENQGHFEKIEGNIDLCIEGTIHTVIAVEGRGVKEIGAETVRQMAVNYKNEGTLNSPNVVDSVRVELYGEGTGLAVAFVDFRTPDPDVRIRDVFTMAFVDGRWKIVTIVQQNTRPKQ